MKSQYSIPQKQTAHNLFTREGTLGSRRLKKTVLIAFSRLQHSEKITALVKIINLGHRYSLATVDYEST